ncbi:MAG: RNA polymerase sigma factor [Steroidobacteraceae bacterium]
MTDEGKGFATPVDSASVAVESQAEAFACAVAAIAAGDTAALTELYDSTVAKVHALVRAIIRNPADAEEVTCDVYAEAWRTASHFDPSRGPVIAWLLNIARYRAIDCLRRQRGRARLFDEQCPQEDFPDAAAYVSPERMLNLFQSRSVVRAALEQLPPERRRLVALAFFEDLSHAEIAEATGLPLGTVKSHLRRAIHSLRGLLCASEVE